MAGRCRSRLTQPGPRRTSPFVTNATGIWRDAGGRSWPWKPMKTPGSSVPFAVDKRFGLSIAAPAKRSCCCQCVNKHPVNLSEEVRRGSPDRMRHGGASQDHRRQRQHERIVGQRDEYFGQGPAVCAQGPEYEVTTQQETTGPSASRSSAIVVGCRTYSRSPLPVELEEVMCNEGLPGKPEHRAKHACYRDPDKTTCAQTGRGRAALAIASSLLAAWTRR